MYEYGNKVFGYEEAVLNEREAKAAAGILFTLGLITVMNSVMIGNGILSRIFLAFFMFDFFLRITFPNYSPSLLLGRYFVRNQTPEYVSAKQKRFAWSIGFVLSIPMFYYLSWNWQPDVYKVLVCIFCLVLLFMEAVFSFCLGCWVYKEVLKKTTSNCPGGACEIQFKDKVQTFNTTQAVIAILTGAFILYMSYFYFYKIENKTYFGEGLGALFMSQEQLQQRADKEFDRMVEDEFDSDDI
ncbi:DUF4395 domain-containing protein [Sulfurimonas sp. SAG-AH-194-I05]|nr:DUF4395 domain-containing protein [Sulfurimonas sp. SAG-AH-194-I05]MDF1875317.1 DUF4395 domain-containing protein [Sulfurimonas sp. SAG-AH-194-I05]